jgi:hypothetical protein
MFQRNILPPPSRLKLVTIYHTTWHHIQEDHRLKHSLEFFILFLFEVVTINFSILSTDEMKVEHCLISRI